MNDSPLELAVGAMAAVVGHVGAPLFNHLRRQELVERIGRIQRALDRGRALSADRVEATRLYVKQMLETFSLLRIRVLAEAAERQLEADPEPDEVGADQEQGVALTLAAMTVDEIVFTVRRFEFESVWIGGAPGDGRQLVITTDQDRFIASRLFSLGLLMPGEVYVSGQPLVWTSLAATIVRLFQDADELDRLVASVTDDLASPEDSRINPE